MRTIRTLLHRLLAKQDESTLVIPFPELTSVLEAVGTATEMLPHITLLYPFASSRQLTTDHYEKLSTVFTAATPFEVTLAEIRHFPGVTYLAPDPPTPFVDLSKQLYRAFPEHPPYGGQFTETIPHFTVVEGDDLSAEALGHINGLLPITITATEACLMTRRAEGPWLLDRTFPLGEASRQAPTPSEA